MLTQKTRYALRTLIHLATHAGESPVRLGELAEQERMPFKYLELIMIDLKRAGIVTSTRGPKGGYRLGRKAEEISFGEVIRLIEGPIALLPCASVNFYAPCGDCHDEATCAIRHAFLQIREHSAQLLEGVTIASATALELSAEAQPT